MYASPLFIHSSDAWDMMEFIVISAISQAFSDSLEKPLPTLMQDGKTILVLLNVVVADEDCVEKLHHESICGSQSAQQGAHI